MSQPSDRPTPVDDVAPLRHDEVAGNCSADAGAIETARHLWNAVQHAPLMVLAVDRQGRITLAEGGGLSRLGLVPGQLLGQNAFEVYARSDAIVTGLRQALAGQSTSCLVRAEGVAYEAAFFPLADVAGSIAGAYGVATDVTSRLAAEDALRTAHDELDRRVMERTADLAASKFSLETEVERRKHLEEISQDQNRVLHTILDHLDSGVVVADENGRIVLINEIGQRVVRMSPVDVPPSEWPRLAGVYHTDQETPYHFEELPLFRAMHGETVTGEEMWLKPPERDTGVYIKVDARPLVSESGRRRGGLALFRDITEQKAAEQALRASETRLRAILDNTPAVIYVKDRDGRYLLINRSYETLFHVDPQKVVGKTDYDLFPREAAEKFRANDAVVVQARESFTFEEIAPQDDGPHTYLSVKFPLLTDSGTIYAICGISTDITERTRAAEELRAEQRFLRQMLRVHERDRQLTAYEIHDGIIQDIAAAVMHLEAAGYNIRHLPQKTQRGWQVSLDLLRRALQEGRRLMSGLRPPILDEAGIVPAIRYLIAEGAMPGGPEIALVVDGELPRLDPVLEGTIFRIVQETLNNVRRHSHAEKAEVRLSSQSHMLKLTVRDWGVGFDLSSVKEDRFGLEGIKKRAAVLGGVARIQSAPDQGTTVTADFPLSHD